MFDIGFSELFIVAVIALLVLGPERLPGAVRKVGFILGKVRASWNGIQDEINRELEAEELKKRIQDETNSVQQTLNNSFDIDAYNERILEQERKIREGIQREVTDPSQPPEAAPTAPLTNNASLTNDASSAQEDTDNTNNIESASTTNALVQDSNKS
ncbi:Sec-independent protein translocase protein TatB [Litoribrevibacter euphylliae]|uniref:Sec-independent protein translocase protein TatB n=1 Tax=Litoribrevibacter euphylliae TaxID=1834034 RepID=A0ABV7HEU2_9GAMM